MMRGEARFRMVLTMADQHQLSRDPVTKVELTGYRRVPRGRIVQ
jgi:hypothetical protein